MSKIISICNQKGGVGKTTTTVNLGVSLAAKGYRVLLVDCDPQGSLTRSFGYDPDGLELTMSNALLSVMQGVSVPDIVLSHSEGVDIVPSNITLAGTELALVTAMSRETILKRYLSMFDGYDYILIDCLPSLGMILQNALSASNGIIIPVNPEYLPVTGLEQLLDTILRIRAYINPNLEIYGIVLTRVNMRTNLSKQVVDFLKESFGDNILIYQSQIPEAVKAAEAPLKGYSIFTHDPRGKVAKAYNALSEEVISND